MDLEPSELTVTLSNKYEGTNNFMGLTDSDDRLIQLEDGIGLLNVYIQHQIQTLVNCKWKNFLHFQT